MPTYLTPGVYVEEISSGSKPIEASPTSVAAFVGVAERGPLNTPVSITKTDDFEATFGGYMPPGTGAGQSYLAHAIAQFFGHGGSRCYVIRIAGSGVDSGTSTALGSADLLTNITAAYEDGENYGQWSEHYDVQVTPSQTDPKVLIDIVVRYWPTPDSDRDPATGDATTLSKNGFRVIESYQALSLWQGSKDYAPTVVNGDSKLVKIDITAAAINAEEEHDLVNADGKFNTETYILAAGNDGVAVDVDTDSSLFENALNSLNTIKDVRLIAIPGVPEQALTGVKYCANRPEQDCIFFMDPESDANSTSEIIAWAGDTAKGATASSYAVLYYPWVKAANREPKGGMDEFPPCAFIMGMCGRIDQSRGVWKAPAGLETGMAGIRGVIHDLLDKEQEQLNPRGINCLRIVPGSGTVIWGARTRATKADPEWRYLPVRRTAIMIERSIYSGIQWAVFEPNDHRLWSSLRANIESFMNGLFRAGAFQGETSSQAYFVRCGLGDTMTQGDIDRGQVIVQVGFAALKPAEFVIVRIQQKVGQE